MTERFDLRCDLADDRDGLQRAADAAFAELCGKDPARAGQLAAVLFDEIPEGSLGLTDVPKEVDETRLRMVDCIRPKLDRRLDETIAPHEVLEDDSANLNHRIELDANPHDIHAGQVDAAYFVSEAEAEVLRERSAAHDLWIQFNAREHNGTNGADTTPDNGNGVSRDSATMRERLGTPRHRRNGRGARNWEAWT